MPAKLTLALIQRQHEETSLTGRNIKKKNGVGTPILLYFQFLLLAEDFIGLHIFISAFYSCVHSENFVLYPKSQAHPKLRLTGGKT